MMESEPNWSSVLAAASGDIRRLAYADRFTTIPVLVKEDVANHSYWVSLYSKLIHDALEPQRTDLVGFILTKALIHDAPEMVSGDYVRTHKYMTQNLKDALDEVEEMIVAKYPRALKSLHDWCQDQSNEVSPEDAAYVKAVVKAADFLSLHQYMNREYLRGNREIMPFINRMRSDLEQEATDRVNSKFPRVQRISGIYDAMVTSIYDAKNYTT